MINLRFSEKYLFGNRTTRLKVGKISFKQTLHMTVVVSSRSC